LSSLMKSIILTPRVMSGSVSIFLNLTFPVASYGECQVQRRRHLERVSRGNQCPLWAGEENDVGAVASLSPAIWRSFDCLVSRQSLWATRQLRFGNVARHSSAHQEMRGSEGSRTSGDYSLGRWIANARILVRRGCRRRHSACGRTVRGGSAHQPGNR